MGLVSGWDLFGQSKKKKKTQKDLNISLCSSPILSTGGRYRGGQGVLCLSRVAVGTETTAPFKLCSICLLVSKVMIIAVLRN